MQIESYKVGSKTLYRCRFWYYKNGIKKSKQKSGFERWKDANSWGHKEKERLEGLKSDSDKITVSQFLERWIGIKENKLSPTTFSGYKNCIRHINKFLGNIKLTRLKLIDIQEMVDKLRSGYTETVNVDGKKKIVQVAPLKYRSVKFVVRTLHAALNYAVRNGDITSNPCDGVEIMEDEKQFEVKVYDADNLRKLLLALRDQQHPLYPAVLLSSLRGLRRGEALGLRWSDIDFEKGIAYIRNNYVVVDKKEYHKKVKTKESERTIAIEGFIAEELKAYKENIVNTRGRIPVFVCETESGKLPHPSHVSRGLKRFQEANNLPVCRYHDLRHTFAVLQLESGTDLDTLKRLLGHSKIGITSDLYLHENINLIKKASVKLDNILGLPCDKNVTKSKNESAGNL